jgi:hypothetical protein
MIAMCNSGVGMKREDRRVSRVKKRRALASENQAKLGLDWSLCVIHVKCRHSGGGTPSPEQKDEEATGIGPSVESTIDYLD